MKYAALLLLLFTQTLRAQSSPPALTFLTGAELRHAIAAAPEVANLPGVFDLLITPKSDSPIYGVHASAPGIAEVHAGFTDVWYIIEGGGTMVTGGTVVSGAPTSPGEIRGPSIANGTPHQIRKGELVIIPPGTPHWISGIAGKEMVYFVVKVPSKSN